MNASTNQPTHFFSFSEEQVDGQGNKKLGKPVNIGVAQYSQGQDDKDIKFNIAPEKLGKGVWFLLENENHPNYTANNTQSSQGDAKKYPTHHLLFREKQIDEQGNVTLGSPIKPATVWPRDNKKGGVLSWDLSYDKLSNGVWTLAENERQKTQTQAPTQPVQQDSFDQAKGQGQNKDQGLSR